MDPIRLVTFDIYGTLLDWQSYVEAAFPGAYGRFLEASAARQLPGAAVLPYRKLLHDVGHALAPHAGEEALDFFADGIGFARPFTDARAIQQLLPLAQVGCASNSDYRHLVDAQKTLGLVFDVTLLAEDWGAYKPHDDAWEQIYDTVTQRLGFDRREWLHVAAYVDFDLAPAKERGVRTCFVPRPGGSDPAEAADLAPDYMVPDLWGLVDLVQQANGAAVRYRVEATARDEAVAAEFVQWMRREHGPDLLDVRGCQSFEVLRLTPTRLACEYLFASQAALDAYLAGPAADMRRKGRERFPEDTVSFARDTATLVGGYRRRQRSDLASPTR